MNPSRIEQAIDEIYNYVEECKPSKLYPSKVVVDREQLYDLLDELRLCAPEEFLTRMRLFRLHISVRRTLCVRQRKRLSVW